MGHGVAEIDRSALLHNLEQVRKCVGPDCRILGVVKAGAYGHGAGPVSKTLVSAGISMLGVAWVEEGVELRKAGIRQPILVMGGATEAEASEALHFDLTPAVYQPSQVHALEKAAGEKDLQAAVHLKVDSGMGRLGAASHSEFRELLAALRRAPHLKLKGVMTHVSEDGPKDRPFTEQQSDRFQEVLKRLAEEGLGAGFSERFGTPIRHAANSAMIVDFPPFHLDMVRPGIMLYGYLPSVELSGQVDLRPVMTLKTRVAQLKRVPAGTPISYGRSFVTGRESLIAVLPVGYADGFPRALSNRGEVLVGGRRAPVIGRVCMDMMLVDLTGHESVEVGQEVVLMGRQGQEVITAEEIAQGSGTIAYEILCGISPRVSRVYKEWGKA